MSNRWATHRHHKQQGFSLLELLIVVTIMFVVTAMAAPSIISSIASYRIKSAASDLAGLIQQCRINAVRTNRAIAVRSAVVGGRQQFYVDNNGDGAYTAGELRLVLPSSVTMPGGNPGDATAGQGYAPQPLPLMFNARGLPCVMNGVICTTNAGTVGFVYYLRGERPLNTFGWAAVRINPAGRVTTVVWSGSSYQQ